MNSGEIKRSHTAHTLSTIQKMKSTATTNEKIPEKKSVFQTKILSQKQYHGKFDRVKLYQYLREEWDKTPILKKKNPIPYTPKLKKYNFGMSEFEIQQNQKVKDSKIQMLKLKNLTKPITYYKQDS